MPCRSFWFASLSVVLSLGLAACAARRGTPTPAPPRAPITTPPSGPSVLSVQQIYVTDAKGIPQSSFGRGDTVYWWVLIFVDHGVQGSEPAAGARVTSAMILPDGTTASFTGTTDADGWASFHERPVAAGAYAVAVAHVTLTGVTFDPEANGENSDSFTIH